MLELKARVISLSSRKQFFWTTDCIRYEKDGILTVEIGERLISKI